MSTDERSPCRDFQKGVCTRGDNCKYFHPEGEEPSENAKLPICKDYQNRGCDRMKCKFLHITVDEEAEYSKTGTLPEHGGKPKKENLYQGKEICRDFLNNRCDRGSGCRFSHVSEREQQMGMAGGMPMGPMYGKRFRDDFGGISGSPNLMEENEMLKRKITEMQKQMLELREMNDTLYEQNTRYRTQLQGNPTLANNSQSNTGISAGPAPVVAAATNLMQQKPVYGYSY